jgi:hypothetical protein
VAHPASIAQDINNQLANLAKKDTILAVSAPPATPSWSA